MKKHVHKLATHTALILISALSFSFPVDAFADADAEKKPNTSLLSSKSRNTSATKRKILADKSQQIADEARDAVSGTQQALLPLEGNDTKTALTLARSLNFCLISGGQSLG